MRRSAGRRYDEKEFFRGLSSSISSIWQFQLTLAQFARLLENGCE
jgi:hypothetical protein